MCVNEIVPVAIAILIHYTVYMGLNLYAASSNLTPASKVPKNTAPPNPIQRVRGTKPEKSAAGPSFRKMCVRVGRILVLTPEGLDSDSAGPTLWARCEGKIASQQTLSLI